MSTLNVLEKEKVLEASDCCGANLVEDFKMNPRDHHDAVEIYSCSECKKECDTVAVCEICLGAGKVEEMEYIQNDSTGFNLMIEGTGEMRACPVCGNNNDN